MTIIKFIEFDFALFIVVECRIIFFCIHTNMPNWFMMRRVRYNVLDFK
jgi:hypothetical protein